LNSGGVTLNPSNVEYGWLMSFNGKCRFGGAVSKAQPHPMMEATRGDAWVLLTLASSLPNSGVCVCCFNIFVSARDKKEKRFEDTYHQFKIRLKMFTRNTKEAAVH
jgi:hypothetical protein